MGYELSEIDGIKNLPEGTQIAVQGLLKDLKPGLATFYTLCIGGKDTYEHHGVYLGDSKVVHFHGANKDKAKPCTCDIHEFRQGGLNAKIYKVSYTDPILQESPYEKILERVDKALVQGWPPYNLVINNCESFATWLKTGTARSSQVNEGVFKIAEKVLAKKTLK
jgi:hypothetical protein